MLGFYENFPENVHCTETFNSSLSSKKLQERFVQTFYEINTKTYNFEEVSHPTVPKCSVIFEVGIADSKIFNYIDKEELEKVLKALKKENIQTIDLFCAIRYYKNIEEKRTPLKFDYYLIRLFFTEKNLELRAFHERGPRYISPDDLTTFLVNKLNDLRLKKILKPVENV